LVDQEAAVRQARQLVEVREFVDAVLDLFAFREVRIRAGQAHRVAGAVAQDEAAAQHGDVVAVAVAQAEFHAVRLALPGQQFVQDGDHAHAVVGMRQAHPGFRVGRVLVGRVAEHVPPARRIIEFAGDEVPVPRCVGRPLQREAHAFLGLVQRLLRVLEDRAVHEADDDALDGAMPVALRIGIADRPAHVAVVRTGHADDEVRHPGARAQDRVHGIFGRRHAGAVRAHEMPGGVARLRRPHLVLAAPQQRQRMAVGGHHAPRGIVHHDTGRQ
ncbi:conserved hypothetical protein, partial [Ricinus communis]